MSRPPASLPKATELAHRLIAERLREGDHAIDATIGNGHDTLFLARIVGASGRVIGFDIQAEAVARTKLRTEGLDQVALHCCSHEHLETFVETPVEAIMFNLGYLPSGDKQIITEATSTVKALNAAVNLLRGGGILTIAVYSGHPGGAEEAAAVEEWATHLSPSQFAVAKYQFVNQENDPPYLLAVGRKPSQLSERERNLL